MLNLSNDDFSTGWVVTFAKEADSEQKCSGVNCLNQASYKVNCIVVICLSLKLKDILWIGLKLLEPIYHGHSSITRINLKWTDRTGIIRPYDQWTKLLPTFD